MYFYELESYVPYEGSDRVYLMRETKCEDFEALCQSLFEAISLEKLESDKGIEIQNRWDEGSDLPPVVMSIANWGDSMGKVIDMLCQDHEFKRIGIESKVFMYSNDTAIEFRSHLGLKDGVWQPCTWSYNYATETETIEWKDK
jgi:hypothetical protein